MTLFLTILNLSKRSVEMNKKLKNEIKLTLITLIVSSVITSIMGFELFFYNNKPIEGMFLLVTGGMLLYHFVTLLKATKNDNTKQSNT